MSPGSSEGTRSAMVWSTTAAGTISHTARGFSSFATRSASEAAPTAFSRASSCTACGARSKTTQWWPPARSRRTMFAPIRPRPIIPSCMTCSFAGCGGSSRASGESLERSTASDQGVRRAVVAESGLRLAPELRDDALRQRLAELHAPLVERVDPPDRTLGEDRVLVERDELSERLRRELLGEDRVRRAIALEGPVGHEPLRRPLGPDLLGRLPEGQRLGLREDVREEHVVLPAERTEGLRERDEIAGDEARPLMDQLVEGVLAVGPRLAPGDGSGRVVDPGPVERHVLAVALHRGLLQIRREALQVLLV